jgi:hypothetical protein
MVKNQSYLTTSALSSPGRLIGLFVLLCAMQVFLAHPVRAAQRIQLSGREAEAVHVSVTAFTDKAHFFYGDLRHFSVEFQRRGKNVEITFLPDEPQHRRASDPEVGGRTRFGYEVHYLISLDSLKVIKIEFAR